MSLTAPDNRVEYELWYSSILDLSPSQMKELGQYQKPFGSSTLFTPRILTFACELCPKEIKERDCVSDGKYCPYKPRHHPGVDYDSFTNLDLLFESLRERCLYNIVYNEDDSKAFHKWYQYMIAMSGEMEQDASLSEELSIKVFKALDIDHKKVHDCVENSFTQVGNYQSNNKIFEEDEKWRSIMNIHRHPAISINNQTYLGDFSGADIARAICASFLKRPDFCIDERISMIAQDTQFSELEELGLEESPIS